MKHGITGIDHPVIAVRDLESAREAYERLGFIVPPRGSHPQWGTGNWCIQFAQGYLELRGILVPGKETHGLGRFLEKCEGLMGVAFGTVGAKVTHDALSAARLHPRPVKPLTRDFELPEGTIPVSFELCFLDPAETPGLMSVVICEHLTPERLRQPDWLPHPNGARGIRGLIGVARQLNEIADSWRKLFERVTEARGEVRAEFDDGGFIAVLEEQTFASRFASIRLPTSSEWPCLAVVSLATQDLRATADYFTSRGVEHKVAERVIVPPDETCGVALEFVNAR